MRLNKFIASGTDLSRRAADAAIASGRVTVNGKTAVRGQDVTDSDTVALDNQRITPAVKPLTIILNKPRGYVVSRDGQGSQTVYDLLPPEYQRLNPVGRLDKDSSGLLLLTNDGQLANDLTHPSRQKVKIYEVALDKPLQPLHQQMISDHGITLFDGVSKFVISIIPTDPISRHSRESGNPVNNPSRSDHISNRNSRIDNRESNLYEIQMREGRNRQIRRTFAALGYTVQTLHRTHFGPYHLGSLQTGNTKVVEPY